MNLTRNRVSLLLLLSVLLFARLFLFFNSQTTYPDGTEIRLSGRLVSEPIQYDNSQRVSLRGYKFYLPLYPKISYGDRVSVVGVVEKDKLKMPKLVRIDSAGTLFGVRNKLLSFYQKSLPKDHAALVAGVVLGAKSGIGTELWEKFKQSGTAHVVVASGMNVTLVSGFILNFLLLFFKRQKALVIAAVGIWTYAVVSGFDAPIVRACVMGTIAFTAQELGKLNYAYRTTSLTAYLMLLAKPEWLSDLGFWLSFLATISILRFEKPIEGRLKIIPYKFLRQDLATSFSAQIGVAPLLYYFFGQFNIFSPLINAFVLWTIVPMTLIGMFAGLVSYIFEPLARLMVYLTYPLTSWFLLIVDLGG